MFRRVSVILGLSILAAATGCGLDDQSSSVGTVGTGSSVGSSEDSLSGRRHRSATGGTTATGGTGGTTASGGTTATGGATASGGVRGTGGAIGTGGVTSTGTGGAVGSTPSSDCAGTPSSTAKIYYACDCGSGADKNCQAGSDSNDGSSPSKAWQSYEKARSKFSSLNAGDRILFCQGGSFSITQDDNWVNSNCRAGNRCVVAAYTPPWASGDEGRPVIHGASSLHGFALDDPANADHEEGYVFSGLELAGAPDGSSWAGFFIYNDIDSVTMCNMSIHDFGTGVDMEGTNPPNSGADEHNSSITMQDSLIYNNSGQGWLGSDNGTVIQNCRFWNNGFARPNFNHNIYLSSSASDGSTNIQVIGNDLYKSTVQNNKCTATSLVAHGILNNVVIQGNTIHEDKGGVNDNCWGISIGPGDPFAESFNRITIRGNTVTNMGNQSIGVSSCHDCVIESNVVINEQAINAQAISAPSLSRMSNDQADDRITVRNNSIYIDMGQGIGVIQEGTGHVIVNNAIYDVGGGNGGVGCFQFDLPSSAYTEIDYNVCNTNGKGDWVVGQGALSSWSSKSGFDKHSKAMDPMFKSMVSPYDLSAKTGSPLLSSGDATSGAPTDILGKVRTSPPDIGAFQH